MYYTYIITNTINNYLYVGITNNIDNRWRAHKSYSRKGKSYLSNAMRKYGVTSFTIEEVKSFNSKEECAQFEVDTISFFRDNNIPNYNLHDGGTFGYSMKEDDRYEEWRSKLKISRVGGKPALGMKHTEKNKSLFKEVSKAYWETQDTYNEEEVCALSFKEAAFKYGISKTHYYRLLKRLKSNELG